MNVESYLTSSLKKCSFWCANRLYSNACGIAIRWSLQVFLTYPPLRWKKKIFWKLKFLYLLSFCHTLDSFRTTVNLKMERSLQTSQLLFQVNLNNFNPWIKPYTPVYTKMIVVSFKRHDFYIENHLAWIAYLYNLNLLCNYLHEGFFL